MGINTKIEWATHTWNPWYGCPDDGQRSPACDHCYARSWAKRCGNVDFDREIKRSSDITFRAPLNRKKYQSGDRVFVCSLSDFFHKDVPDAMWSDAWDIINERDDLTWMFLTKRPQNISVPLNWAPYDPGSSPRNHWLGVTVENQKQAHARIPALLRIPAAVHFVSVEPLLGPIHMHHTWLPASTNPPIYSKRISGFHDLENSGIRWVIVGGESGPHARPMHPDWVRSLREQCDAAGVPFMFKQWGEYAPVGNHQPDGTLTDFVGMERIGKAAAGRILDGKTYDGFPE